MIDVKGKNAIITGAGSGIGAEMARIFEQAGITVARWDIHFESEIQSEKSAVICDVTKEESVLRALERTLEKIGRPHYLINCAGKIYGEKLISDQGPASLSRFEDLMEVNLTGCFNVMRLVANQMKDNEPYSDDQERGAVLNLASIAAYEGQVGQIAYAASKGGIVSMTLPAARELAQWGVRVNAIAPGVVDTPMMDKVPEKVRTQLSEVTPFPKRFARPEEISRLALEILENPMINGEVIRLDGAIRMPAR